MMNSATIMGRLTATPELKKTNNDKSVTTFTVAVDARYGDGTNFIDCVAWGNTAEFISKWFVKGKMIAVTGEIQTRSWNDKSGNKRKSVEINVENVSFCGDKEKADNAQSYTVTPKEADYETVNVDDDLPF